MKLNSQFHYYNAYPFQSSWIDSVFPHYLIFTYTWAIELAAKLIPKQSPDLSPKLSRDDHRHECWSPSLSLASINFNPRCLMVKQQMTENCRKIPRQLYTSTSPMWAKTVIFELWTILNQYHKYRMKEVCLDSSWKWKEHPYFRAFICGNSVMELLKQKS